MVWLMNGGFFFLLLACKMQVKRCWEEKKSRPLIEIRKHDKRQIFELLFRTKDEKWKRKKKTHFATVTLPPRCKYISSVFVSNYDMNLVLRNILGHDDSVCVANHFFLNADVGKRKRSALIDETFTFRKLQFKREPKHMWNGIGF